ncbi:NADPH-dependent 2,4-dienoyl-CoA reductase/sulfur reductase-like enzyme/peroxiredoxin family protein/rhodanese-related sulfurtransferase/TusA-related sulfurtransferase [Paenibacillus anaericanus]|uniref:FAD-dependent oxidoreductase n=1 Tax=Paenibacillus anaericanus TaxID=170367 RepID=UPI00277FA7D7|nr:FAD-dependent oxidoreductase [Paenibacillus anaericanus]MDQ0087519.1 NADPH-dependent 2,4-dienoyl-CoA reductase/sulfur reductase-like enzyme/peroxiredoxin family protein/rhodanese-related sulfurtransferase/TusA-related sulfurtransferase [Paenibacillus anaericanus]
MSKKVLIVGGVAGGASAAARLRRLDEDAHIVMFERDHHISFANCGLPYYIGDSIKERSKLLIQTPEAMYKRFNIDVRIESEVISLDPYSKTVRVRSKERGEYDETYDAVILSPGARPIKPPLPGINGSGIHTLRNIPDTDRIKKLVTEQSCRTAVVIGGGFIGVEMAENLRELGLEVTLVEGGPQLLAPFDYEMSGKLSKELEQHGVNLVLNDGVASFAEQGTQTLVNLASGTAFIADIVVLAIGVAPDTGFLSGSGLELGPRGHIVVNERMETNLEHVYAVGDAIEVTDYVSGFKTAVPLAGPANKQGRIAADNVAGLPTAYRGTQGTSIIKVFGLTGATTGNNEKTLTRLGIPYHVTYVHPNSHASYYPGAMPMTIKLLFNESGTILGAQAVGHIGVDKRIDDIATVIHFKGNVSDLAELELAYAPPYSSAKDPVNMAGYTAENVVSGRTAVYLPKDLESRDTSNTVLVDVRSAIEHANGHIPDSLLIPVDELRSRLGELDKNKEIWVYCQVGLRGYTASRILSQHGFKVRNLTGGYSTYLMSQYQPASITGDTGAGAAANAQPSILPNKTAEEEVATALEVETFEANVTLDACGLSCPGPLIGVKKQMDQMQDGNVLKVTASDPGFYEDIKAWARMAGAEVLQIERKPEGMIEAYLRKKAAPVPAENTTTATVQSSTSREGSTMVVFSGELDKAIASFIIANGAAASGKKVTMFFTFWGLNVLRRPDKVNVPKSFIGRMFGAMMPRGSRKLGLSNMNMLGAGSILIRKVMQSRNIASLEELIQSAVDQGVEMVACQMSMDVMGIVKEELIDGVKIGGVGYYLGQADQSGHNLFI